MSKRHEDRVPRLTVEELAAPGGDAPFDLESEPRKRWKPNAQLLSALAAAQKDLRPGEASLFWDWTATRESVPEAEDLRPSDHGELLVSDMDAAAAYVPPVEVAPAKVPRAATKSRIRVREDVDPRRQPTMKTSRSSDPAGGSGASSDSVPPSEADDRTSEPAGDRPSDTLLSGRDALVPDQPYTEICMRPSLAEERRRRLAGVLLLGAVTATIVFFWLRLPRDLDARIGGDRAAATADVPPRSAPASVPPTPNAVEEPEPPLPPPSTLPASVPVTPKSSPNVAPAPRSTLRPKTPAPPATTTPGGSGFLIRKKGD